MDIEFTGEEAKKLHRTQALCMEPFCTKEGKAFYKISGIAGESIPELGDGGTLFVSRNVGEIELYPDDIQKLVEGFSLRDKQKNGRDVYVIPRNAISKQKGSALMRVGLAFPIQKKGSDDILGYTCDGVKFFNNKSDDGITPVLTPKACFELLDQGKTEAKDYTLELAELRPSIWRNKDGQEFPQQEAIYCIKKKSLRQDRPIALKKTLNFGNCG